MKPLKLERRLVRFDLALCQDGKALRNACFDLRVGDEDHAAVIWRADPDDVRALKEMDPHIIAMNGGQAWEMDMRARRSDRRSVFIRLGGMLGEHLCDEIEKAEGWADA